MSTTYVLGVDVGGNHVKTGFVDPAGGIHQFQSFYTKDFVASGDFTDKLIQTLKFRLLDFGQGVNKVGIGFPGTLSKDRNFTLNIPSLPELSSNDNDRGLT
jgi:glucokinase